MKWRPGSTGEKEAKQNRIIAGFAALVSIGVLLCLFVLDTYLKVEVKASPVWMNVVGGLLVAGSVYPVVAGFKAGEEGVKSYILAWAAALACGILIACGFYSYTY